MHSKCPLVRERSQGGSLDRGQGKPNPRQNRTFLQTCPLLGERPAGDQSQRGKRESSRKGPYRANPGARERETEMAGQEPREAIRSGLPPG